MQCSNQSCYCGYANLNERTFRNFPDSVLLVLKSANDRRNHTFVRNPSESPYRALPHIRIRIAKSLDKWWNRVSASCFSESDDHSFPHIPVVIVKRIDERGDCRTPHAAERICGIRSTVRIGIAERLCDPLQPE